MEHSALSIFPKDAANRRKVSFIPASRVQLILCKDNISDLHSQKYESKNEPLPCRYITVDVTP